MKKLLVFSAALALIGAGCVSAQASITTFEECAAAGNPVTTSYPPQCRANGRTFVQAVAPSPEPATSTPEIPQDQPVTLKQGESATFDGGLKVTVKSINDSRCAKGVTCIWAGELSAVLQVDSEGSGSQTVTLGTITKPTDTALGYGFKLEAITPTTVTISVAHKLMM